MSAEFKEDSFYKSDRLHRIGDHAKGEDGYLWLLLPTGWSRTPLRAGESYLETPVSENATATRELRVTALQHAVSLVISGSSGMLTADETVPIANTLLCFLLGIDPDAPTETDSAS